MSPSTALNGLAEEYHKRLWNRFPSVGSAVGAREYDRRLEAPDEALLRDQLKDARDTLARFQELPAAGAGASPGERLDRRAFEAQLRMKILSLDTIAAWRSDPADPADSFITSIFYLVIRRDTNDRETAVAVAERLKAAPAYLEAVKSRLSDPVSLWVDVAAEVAGGGTEFVNDVAKGLSEKHPGMAGDLSAAAATATSAIGDYIAWLGTLKNRKLRTDPSIGAAAMSEVVKWDHGLTEPLDGLAEYGRSQMAHYKTRLDAVAKTIDPSLTPREIMDRESRRYAEAEPDMLAEYRKVTFELRDRLVSEGVLQLPPGESCDVISTPAFLRPLIPTAAYSAPGPMDKDQRGIFYVSDPPRSLSREDYVANVAQHFPIGPTCAHEAYPGHHVQLCSANRAPSLIRKLSDHIIFMEGWTLYCEQMMVDLGWYATPVHELGYLNDQLWRACRIVIDVGVQSGRMTVPEAIEMLQKEVGFTPLRATTELNWYTQRPGTPMSYLLGKGKTLLLREKYMAAHPGASLKEFHGWLLGHGSIPQTWLLEGV